MKGMLMIDNDNDTRETREKVGRSVLGEIYSVSRSDFCYTEPGMIHLLTI